MSPRRPKRPCPGAGRYKGRCPALIDHGVQVCPRCAPLAQEQQRQAGREYDRDRPSSTQRGYGSAHWRKLRLMILRRQPLCACGCGQASTEVHHVDGDSSNNDWDNLEALTKECHSRITAKEAGFNKK